MITDNQLDISTAPGWLGRMWEARQERPKMWLLCSDGKLHYRALPKGWVVHRIANIKPAEIE